MTETPPREFFVWTVFQQLVQRDFAIGLDEYIAVMRALHAGFGLASRNECKEMLCALWASSRDEATVVNTLLDRYLPDDWDVATTSPIQLRDANLATLETPTPPADTTNNEKGAKPAAPKTETAAETAPAPAITPTSRLPPLRMEDLPRLPYSHVFLPLYPVGYRHVAQAWRRLRWPLREGPATELDVDATIARRAHLGVASAPVLRPRRRNQANLLLLVDRKGSMAPFHGFVTEVCTAIAESGRLGRVGQYYFHDTPLEGAELSVLGSLDEGLFPNLDPILGEVAALTQGEFFEDHDLLRPCSAASVINARTHDTAIVIVSDAGAARGRFDTVRLLDTIASLKGLLTLSSRLVWLNPMPEDSWVRSTAGQIARHVPMFPMERDGMHRAVNVLRGQPIAIEHPLSYGSYRTPATASTRQMQA